MGVCVECGAESSLVCSRCRAAAYCGAACQRAAWAQHKLPCESAALAKLQGTLEGLGFSSKALGRCALGAIVRGHLLFSGGAAELDAPARLRGGGALTVRDQGSGNCRHGHSLRKGYVSSMHQVPCQEESSTCELHTLCPNVWTDDDRWMDPAAPCCTIAKSLA
jgi:uncharacterized protein YaiE (UPF0345 family)